MKWAKTTAQLDDINPDPVSKKVCFEEYHEIKDDGTIIEDGKTKKKIKGQKKASASDTFTEWVTYPYKEKNSEFYPVEFSPDLDLTTPLNLDKGGRERYEIFCGGFLFYHDVIVKKYYSEKLWKKYYDRKKKDENKTDIEIFEHKIYFEWFGDGDIKLDEASTEIAKKVTIYITPTPDDLNPDPPDPPGGPPPY